MRVPIRKGGQYTNMKDDPVMTQGKFDELKKTLEKLKKDIQPKMAEEVKRLALMGDFSENAAYQIAKGRLRFTNSKIENITKQIAEANIIKINKNKNVIEIGSLVTVKIDQEIKKYHILGSSETDPSKGKISYQSPLGAAFLNKKIDEIVEIKINGQITKYQIIAIDYQI
ncbi:MAG: GreA/GreB family elongation factor [Patescibacteria group bacterium]|jgi:transcription elongation factor GreA